MGGRDREKEREREALFTQSSNQRATDKKVEGIEKR
jgi:hypothetical protein